MMPLHTPRRRQQGLSLIELMIAMVVSLMTVLAATSVYLATRQTQRSIETTSTSLETGGFAMQLLGREIMNAGFYPANMAPIPPDVTQTGMYDTYPPLQSTPRVSTDWMDTANSWPPKAYQTGLYGCDNGLFAVKTATCPTGVAGTPDSIVVNYFTNDTMSNATGRRRDCTGANVDSDPSNATRKLNTGTPASSVNAKLPPQLPLFVSNRFSLRNATIEVEKQQITTKSLVCSGNGSTAFGADDSAAYVALLTGVEDMQFTYGVYSSTAGSLVPDRFYTAAEVEALSNVTVNGTAVTPWQRVAAVRVCLLTLTFAGGTRNADKSGAARTYLDCTDTQKNQPVGKTYKRFVQVFGVRNNLKSLY